MRASNSIVWKAAWCYSRFRNIVGIVFCLWNGCDVYQIYRIIGDVLFLFSFWEIIAEWWCTETEPPEQAMEPKPKAIILFSLLKYDSGTFTFYSIHFFCIHSFSCEKEEQQQFKGCKVTLLVWGLHHQRVAFFHNNKWQKRNLFCENRKKIGRQFFQK